MRVDPKTSGENRHPIWCQQRWMKVIDKDTLSGQTWVRLLWVLFETGTLSLGSALVLISSILARTLLDQFNENPPLILDHILCAFLISYHWVYLQQESYQIGSAESPFSLMFPSSNLLSTAHRHSLPINPHSSSLDSKWGSVWYRGLSSPIAIVPE